MQGAVIWITGASSGIGKALAIEASSRGASVILSGRKAEKLADTARECAAASSEARTAILPFDLEDPEARAEACRSAPGLLGPLDVLVLNAGMSQRSTFLETSTESFDRIMALDFGAQVDLIRRCLPAMVGRDSGCIVGISSIAGLAGFPLRPAYSSAKHALAGLLQNIRSELSGTKVRIVTVYPGYVRTPIAVNALDGSGRPTGEDDPRIVAGADPARCARRIADAIGGGRVEVKIAFTLLAHFGIFLSRRFPSAFADISAKYTGTERLKGSR
ncbi:MAG: SDR family NAD(P)-dependent oxidoreductase [Spirochaetaceae bacterium]|nr:SDR family NAD(P)-dependent oxidoreductase [Spirochaetaceae bacterium]